MQKNKQLQSQITTTQVSLPKGGGAIQGIGETFQANEFTGSNSHFGQNRTLVLYKIQRTNVN